MKRPWVLHGLFGVALAALIALSAWWTVYIVRSVEVEHLAHATALRSMAEILSVRIGSGDAPIRMGVVPEVPQLEVIDAADRVEGDLSFACLPRHPGVAVRPLPSAVAWIEMRNARRWTMVVGEGSLLSVLLLVVTAMLWRLVRQESRQFGEMELFVSAMTHEMKTPLAGIKSLLQTLAVGRVPEDRKPRLYAMGLKEAEKLEHSIENALIAGHLRRGTMAAHVEAQPLRPLLRAFVTHRERILLDRPDAIRLQWDIATDDLEVLADADHVRVILENLADNGFKYGGDRPSLTVRARLVDDEARVDVIDQGIGFEPSEAANLFIPFHRFQRVRRSGLHGTGLGLSMARALAEQMGGTLSAGSEGPGRGSTFTLHLRTPKNAAKKTPKEHA